MKRKNSKQLPQVSYDAAKGGKWRLRRIMQDGLGNIQLIERRTLGQRRHTRPNESIRQQQLEIFDVKRKINWRQAP